MKSLFSAITVVIVTFFLTACEDSQNSQSSSQKSEDAAKNNADIKIALVMKTLTNPFFITMEKGARRAEKELGITLIVKTAAQETSTTQQISIVDRLVREKEVKAIVIAPADSVKLIPSLKKAQETGIHVINIDNRLDTDFSKKAGLENVPFISIDNEKSAYLVTKELTQSLGSPSKAGIIEGIRTASNAQARKNGAVKALNENPNIQVVASETAFWQIDEGYEVAKKMLADAPDISVLVCGNDMMALGAVEYLKETNNKTVTVIGFDAIDEAMVALNDGWLSATVDQQPAEQGYLGIKMALEAIEGKELPNTTLLEGLIKKR